MVKLEIKSKLPPIHKFVKFGSFPPLAIIQHGEFMYLHWTVDPTIHAYEIQQKEIHLKREKERKDREIFERNAYRDLLRANIEDICGNIFISQQYFKKSRKWQALMSQEWDPLINNAQPETYRQPVQKVEIELLSILDSEERYVTKHLTKAAKNEIGRLFFHWSEKNRELIDLINDIADRVAFNLITNEMCEEPYNEFHRRILIVPPEWRVPKRVVRNIQQHVLAQHWRFHNILTGEEDLIHSKAIPRAGSTLRLRCRDLASN